MKILDLAVKATLENTSEVEMSRARRLHPESLCVTRTHRSHTQIFKFN